MEEKKKIKNYILSSYQDNWWGLEGVTDKSTEKQWENQKSLLQGCHAWLSLQSMKNADAATAHGMPECAAHTEI